MKTSSGSLLLFLCLISTPASAAILYGHGNRDGSLYEIDTEAQTVTLLGRDLDRRGPDIELSPDGTTVYMVQQPDKLLFAINPANGQSISSIPLTGFPTDPPVFSTSTATALATVGGTLYGSFHESGVETKPGQLAIIDVETGVISHIGSMAPLNRPSGGMAYVGGVMYAVSSTANRNSVLFTVDLNTGAASSIAPLTLDGVQQQTVTGLVYADGTMYAIMNTDPDSDSDTAIYSVETDGRMTREFDPGIEMNALANAESEFHPGEQGQQGEQGPQGEDPISGSVLFMTDDRPVPEGYRLLGSYVQKLKSPNGKSRKARKSRKSGKSSKSKKITFIVYQRD
jgi:hypothetical protein